MCPLTTRKCINVAIVNLNQKKRTKSASMVLKSIACGKCDKFNTLERNYKLLKENYERLNTINKNVQDQAKDKQFAQDVQIAELRTNYDSVKAENVKIKDNLETQNKLWKIWLVKMDDKKDESEPKSIPKDAPPKSDVPEEEVEVINTEEDNDHTVNSEEIYQQFIKNKERGFKRTSPTTNPSPKKCTDVKCEMTTLSEYIKLQGELIIDHR